MDKRRVVGLIILGLFLIISGSTYAAALQTIGQVVWVTGTLKASQPNTPARVLARRSPIYEHDIIVSDATSTGEIVFTDGSTMSLQDNTTIRLDQYKYGGGTAPSSDAFVVSVVKGGFRTITGAISKNNPNGYQANTPVATIGVQGTEYYVHYSKEKGLVSKIEKGSIVIENPQGKIKLTKCSTNEIQNKQVVCQDVLYGQVTSLTNMPRTLAQQPTALNEPPLTPASAPPPSAPSGGAGGGTTPSGGTGDITTPGNGTRTINNNFCIT